MISPPREPGIMKKKTPTLLLYNLSLVSALKKPDFLGFFCPLEGDGCISLCRRGTSAPMDARVRRCNHQPSAFVDRRQASSGRDDNRQRPFQTDKKAYLGQAHSVFE